MKIRAGIGVMKNRDEAISSDQKWVLMFVYAMAITSHYFQFCHQTGLIYLQ